MKEAEQWRIRIIAAWPMAPKGDPDGRRAHDIAQKSMLRSATITAALDSQSEHNYISRELARSLMGRDGTRLAESASRNVLLGQVGVILRCGGSQGDQTETFLLRDLKDCDMLLSPRGWASLEKQCDDLADDDSRSRVLALDTGTPKTLAYDPILLQCAFENEPNCSTESLRWLVSTSTAKKSTSPHTTESLSDSSSPSERWIQTPCSTPERLPSPPAAAILRAEIHDAAEHTTGTGSLVELSARHHRLHVRNHAREKRAETRRKHFHQVWLWDPEKQNYFCRGRDKDDDWYWYPTELV